jgi:Uncharacterized ACR, COG1678
MQDQLRTEAQLGAWFVFPADVDTVFNSDPDSLWLRMIQKTELQLATDFGDQTGSDTFKVTCKVRLPVTDLLSSTVNQR